MAGVVTVGALLAGMGSPEFIPCKVVVELLLVKPYNLKIQPVMVAVAPDALFAPGLS